LHCNSDFAHIFLTFWFYSCDFKKKVDFIPALLSPYNTVNFLTNEQLYPYIFTHV